MVPGIASKSSDARDDQMFRLLRQLDIAPDASQRAMAQTIGISLGRLNALLRDATTAGFVKIGDKDSTDKRQRYSYALTTRGAGEKIRLTDQFLTRKFAEYDALYRDLGPQDIRPNVEPLPQKGGEGHDSIDTAIAGYFGACTALDASFGRLLDHLRRSGLDKNTIVVFTSDHGEMMGSHGLMTKGVCFEESINVPLMIKIPGVGPSSSALLFNSVDLMPTLMGLCGIEVPADIDGRDFSRFFFDPSKLDQPDKAYIGISGFRGWRTSEYTYITTVHPSGNLVGRESRYLNAKRNRRASHILFDLINDPYHQHPILHGDHAHTDRVIDDLHDQLHAELTARGETILDHVG